MGLLDWFGGAQTAVENRSAEVAQAKAATQVGQAQQYIQSKFVDAYVQDLKSTVSTKCFERCFDPKNSDKKIDASEGGCHALCCDRYREPRFSRAESRCVIRITYRMLVGKQEKG